MHNWEIEDPYLRTWVLLGQSFEAAYRAVQVELGQHDLTLAQFHILMLLDSTTVPLSPGQISTFVFREKHTISTLLIRMEKAGYIERVKSNDDERVIWAQIKPKGQVVLAKVKGGILGYAHNLMDTCFDLEEVLQLASQLKKIRNHALGELGQTVQELPPIFRATGI